MSADRSLKQPGRYLIGTPESAQWVVIEEGGETFLTGPQQVLFGPGVPMREYGGHVEKEVLVVRPGQPVEPTFSEAFERMFPKELGVPAGRFDEQAAQEIRKNLSEVLRLIRDHPAIQVDVVTSQAMRIPFKDVDVKIRLVKEF